MTRPIEQIVIERASGGVFHAERLQANSNQKGFLVERPATEDGLASLSVQVSETLTWRNLCIALFEQRQDDDPSFLEELDELLSFNVTGASGIGADALRMMWRGSSSHAEIACWVSRLPTVSLGLAEQVFESLLTEEAVDLVEEVAALPLEKAESLFREALAQDGTKSPLNFLSSRLEAEGEKERQRTLKDRVDRLAPFANQIFEVANQFSDQPGGRIGAGISGSKPSQRALVIRWLETYVLKHGRWPVGEHEIRSPFFGGDIYVCQMDFGDSSSGVKPRVIES